MLSFELVYHSYISVQSDRDKIAVFMADACSLCALSGITALVASFAIILYVLVSCGCLHL